MDKEWIAFSAVLMLVSTVVAIVAGVNVVDALPGPPRAIVPGFIIGMVATFISGVSFGSLMSHLR